VGKSPVAITSGFGAIWVANQDDGTVTRIDPKTRKATGVIGGITGTPVAISAGSGGVWVTTLEGRLFRINSEVGASQEVPIRFRGRLPGLGLSLALNGVAAADGVVWLLWNGGAELLRFDPSSGTIVKIDDPRSPVAIAVGDDAVWLSELNTVSR